MTEGKRYKTRQQGIRIAVPGKPAVSFDHTGHWPPKTKPPCTDVDVQKFLESHHWYGKLFVDADWKPTPKTIKELAPQINMALSAVAKIPGLVPSKMPEKLTLPTLRDIHFMKKDKLLELVKEHKIDVDTSLPYRILKEEVKGWLKSQED